MNSPRRFLRLLCAVPAIFLTACGTVPELPLDTTERTYTGRRWFVHTDHYTCFLWGYLKTPDQSWPGPEPNRRALRTQARSQFQ